MQLLQHAAQCVDAKECKSRNCLKMKEFLKHDQTCQIKAAKGCNICKRIQNILQLHARSCKVDNCKVPSCTQIKDYLKQIEMRQQLMDDRRRVLMNDLYHRPSTQATEANED